MTTKKHITFIGLNFYPESTAIGLYSTQLVDFLEEQGYEISVITAFPYYPQWKIADDYQDKPRFFKEQKGNTTLYRYKQYTPKNPTFLKRVFHIIDFTIGSYFNLRNIKQSDLVIAIVPFTSAAFLGGWVKRRLQAKLWVHIQDFEFDAAFQSGLMQSEKKAGNFLYKLLMRLERYTLNKADTVSTISHYMMDMLARKTKQPTYFLPNWVDENDINPETAQQHPYLTSKKFKILYSGNIGDKQDWDFFEQLIKHIDFTRFELKIVGDGAKRADIATHIEAYSGISLSPPVPYSALSDLLCSADVHILFQKPEIQDTVMPSKILGMMASNKPSIVTGHPESEVRHIMQESGSGFYNPTAQVEQVIDQLEQLVANKKKSAQMGNNARQYVLKHFSRKQILHNFITALDQL